MSKPEVGLDAFSATRIERVDAVCERFERAWEAALRPRIEDYLGDEAEPARSVLLHELLLSELEWRLRHGERPSRPEYRDRLPSHGAVIDAAFEAIAHADHRPDSGAGQDGGPSAAPHIAGQRFRIVQPHAEGGLGIIYRAHDEELQREVALKEIQPRFATRPEERARFLREAEITGSLEHPGIVPVYSLGRYPDGRPYYAMRLIQGTNLKEAIEEFHQEAREGKEIDPGSRLLALRKLLDRFRTVCEALAYVHSRGILHRDVKPQNIMIGRYGETLLVDWGLAKSTGRADTPAVVEEPSSWPIPSDGSDATVDWGQARSREEGSDATSAGSIVGTPAYMSPEQAEGGSERVGPASDVYGLGATLYHLLTGRLAFEGSATEVLAKVRRGEFPKPRSVRRDVPRALEAVCLKAMALRPADRYASAGDLADDVERWQADEPVTAWREPWLLRARRWARRHRVLIIAALAAVLLTAVVLGGCVLIYCLEHVQMTWSGKHHHP
jgi:serine/threonine-protein kinase